MNCRKTKLVTILVILMTLCYIVLFACPNLIKILVNPNPACVGETVKFSLQLGALDADSTSFSFTKVEYELTAPNGNKTTLAGNANTLAEYKPDIVGEWKIKLTAAEGDLSKKNGKTYKKVYSQGEYPAPETFSVVGVKEIIKPKGLLVASDFLKTFVAKPDIPSSTFPAGHPIWFKRLKGSGDWLPISIGNPGGEEKSIGFEDFGVYEVKAKCGTSEKIVEVTVIKISLVSVDFTSDHGVLLNNETDIEPSGDRYNNIEYIPNEDGKVEPFSHTTGQKVNSTIKVKLEPADSISVKIRIFMLSDEANFLVFEKTGIEISAGENSIKTTSDAEIPKCVKHYKCKFSLTAVLEENQEFCFIEETVKFDLFATWGTPETAGGEVALHTNQPFIE